MSDNNVAENEIKKPKGLSIAGMVLGIVALVFALATCTASIGLIVGISFGLLGAAVLLGLGGAYLLLNRNE